MASAEIAVLVCAFILCYTKSALSKTVPELKTEILDHILPKNSNEVLVSPGNSTNGPTTVKVSMHVMAIELHEDKMEFTVNLILRQTWNDHRLKFDNKEKFQYIVINDPGAIWTPNLVFTDIKRGHGYDVAPLNTFLRIYPDGSVASKSRHFVTASCPMNLKTFPFDKQECHLRIAEWLPLDDIVVLWKDDEPITVQERMQIPLFGLEKVSTSVTVIDRSVLTAHFHLSRTFSYYLYHFYIPSVMFVLLSWLPFWMHKKLLSSRFMISLGAMLTYSLLIYDFNKHQAKVPYMTRLSTFAGTCLSFLFVSLIENLLVQMLMEEDGSEAKDCLKKTDEKVERIKCWIARISCKTNYADGVARIVVPLTFAVFCIIYFATV